MMLFSSEDYLNLIGDWRDPYPVPILEEHNKIIVVRDDLLN